MDTGVASVRNSATPAPLHFLFDVSLWTLLLANTFTIYLAYAEQWNIFDIVIVYWAQSVIIGIFNVVRMLSLKNFSIENITINGAPPKSPRVAQLYFAGFFAVHYGFFHLVYLIFIVSGVFGKSSAGTMTAMLATLGVPIALFLGNHLFSYLQNHEADEAKRANLVSLMFFPYARIIPMHLTIIFGGILGAAGASSLTLLLFLSLKMLADVVMHVMEHGGSQTTLAPRLSTE